MKCRHCRQTFEPRPDKKGFINECPECEGQRYRVTEAPSHEGAGPWDKRKMKKKRKKPRPMSAFRRLMREISRKQKLRVPIKISEDTMNKQEFLHFSAKFFATNLILLWMNHRQWHKVGAESCVPVASCARRKSSRCRSSWSISRTMCCPKLFSSDSLKLDGVFCAAYRMVCGAETKLPVVTTHAAIRTNE
jgi:hypothetical protein